MTNPLIPVQVQVVPEKTIRLAASDPMLGEGNNSFIYALESGKVFKENQLSPLYLLDNENMTIYVTSKQYIKKMFH